ncbi:MAG: TadE/TadG family type IV pilus assembly protein [Streptosporangiaceae bacterium]
MKPGLASAILRLLRRDDSGAIAVLVAVLIAGGVLTGMGALVIDVGQLYAARAQLQNGADAAALAVARSCAAGTCMPGTAAEYADANAGHGGAAVSLVCGSEGLGQCTASAGKMTDCPPPPGGPDYVDVHTISEAADGSSLLPPSFARALPGNTGYKGTTVGACAQAEWGPPLTATTMAFTISACEWDTATSLGTVFGSAPPDPAPAPSLDQVLTLRSAAGDGCPGEPAGADGPGTFGWAGGPAGTCQADITGSTYGASTGASAGQSCTQVLAAAAAGRAPVEVPVYVVVTGTGSSADYTLKGFAAFVVTGYHLPGSAASDWLNPANNCTGQQQCINGFFVRGLVPASGPVGGPDLGATEIRLSG